MGNRWRRDRPGVTFSRSGPSPLPAAEHAATVHHKATTPKTMTASAGVSEEALARGESNDSAAGPCRRLKRLARVTYIPVFQSSLLNAISADKHQGGSSLTR
ncbi:hypothetical protein MRX96_057238 [Rhipicephalus microplus]